MSGSHVAPPSHHHSSNNNNSGSGWKVAVLVIVLLIAIAALCFLLWQLFGESIMGMIGGGGSSNDTATIAPGIFTQVGAEYSSGKNVAGNLTVNQGTQRPAEIPAEAENVVLLDISWTGSKEQTEPVYLTVSDPSFTDGDGLAVYEYDTTQTAWEQVGTYRIQNSSVTFQAEDMTSFAFQVISSTPVVPTASPIPEATPEPSPTPEPTPEPTPAPAAVVDYGAYPAVQSGTFTLADEIEDDAVYVFALVKDLPAAAAPAEEGGEEDTSSSESSSGEGGVDFTYVDAPTNADGGTEGTGDAAAAAAAPAVSAPTATVLMNMGNDTLSAVEMPLAQNADGVWCLAGPVTEGMLWTANRDAYKDERRFSLGNHDRYLNTDENFANIILTDNHIRTRWLIQQATLADGSQINTLNYRDDDRYYVSAFGEVVETISDSLFPAGEVPAEPNPLAAQVTYLGTAAPADQTMLREVLRFSVTTDETLAQQMVLFKLNQDAAAPASVQSTPASSITVPVIDENSDLSMLDIRDGTSLLQLGVDYTIAAKVYNNSTVVVVITFMGKYTGQIVRTYSGTFFRTDASQMAPTPTPEPTATPAPVTNNNTGGGGGTTSWVPPTTPTQNPASSTDTQTYDDPTDS